ncbi:hypothetical protein [Sphingomonas sp. RIT328]|uniref:hypothetical protein n=1 Tax=Sphingomonas sp. RIT328 TaxID=1470591 RepID=UPI00045150E0|nr:hypothetical protein [Sphingomonas sp. RIT328]EZP57459.1 hypothetical protein BW41_00304 [Sphingomonas sp. RIT328]
MIVIHGPQRSGKTLHRELFAKHYGCNRIVDDVMCNDRRIAEQEGDLLLSNEDPDKLARRFPGATIVSIDNARANVGLDAVPVGGFQVVAQQRTCPRVDALAAKLAAGDGLCWAEVCVMETDIGQHCESSTCIAAFHEDHDPQHARAWYRSIARTSFDFLVNTPETADFMAGVPLEATHQRDRWSSDHDAGKTPFDWFWLIGYLAQKAAAAAVAGDVDKARHHTISTAAALANWHAALSDADTTMRPGIEPPDLLESTNSQEVR